MYVALCVSTRDLWTGAAAGSAVDGSSKVGGDVVGIGTDVVVETENRTAKFWCDWRSVLK